jgi:hypothetical protein
MNVKDNSFILSLRVNHILRYHVNFVTPLEF